MMPDFQNLPERRLCIPRILPGGGTAVFARRIRVINSPVFDAHACSHPQWTQTAYCNSRTCLPITGAIGGDRSLFSCFSLPNFPLLGWLCTSEWLQYTLSNLLSFSHLRFQSSSNKICCCISYLVLFCSNPPPWTPLTINLVACLRSGSHCDLK